jgi:hypothetical protein
MILKKLVLFQVIPIFQMINWIFFNILGIKNDLLYWGKTMKHFFRWNQYIIPGSAPFYKKKCVYFHNHREIIDIAIDTYTTSGNSAFISRYLVMFVAPLIGLTTTLLNSAFYFKRSKNMDKYKFIEWCNYKLKNSPYQSLSIYPEGTRRISNEPCRIKDGGILYSYQYDVPIQIIITKNKENVFSVKKFTHQDNVSLYTYISREIYPKDFNSFEKYRTNVCNEWEKNWNIVYQTEYNPDRCSVFEPENIDIDPKHNKRIYIFRMISISFICFTFSKLFLN